MIERKADEARLFGQQRGGGERLARKRDARPPNVQRGESAMLLKANAERMRAFEQVNFPLPLLQAVRPAIFHHHRFADMQQRAVVGFG